MLYEGITIYGCPIADRAFVLISDQLKYNQVEHILRDCGVSVLVYGETCSETALRSYNFV